MITYRKICQKIIPVFFAPNAFCYLYSKIFTQHEFAYLYRHIHHFCSEYLNHYKFSMQTTFNLEKKIRTILFLTSMTNGIYIITLFSSPYHATVASLAIFVHTITFLPCYIKQVKNVSLS